MGGGGPVGGGATGEGETIGSSTISARCMCVFVIVHTCVRVCA